MNWSDINIMDVIAGAIISAASAIVVLALSIWATGRRDRALVEKDIKINSQEHDKLSVEHSRMKERLSMEHQSIKDLLAPIRENAKATHNILLGEVGRREIQYDNLSESQKDMKAQFENLQKMAGQWEALISENKDLKEQIKELTKERDLAREKNRELNNDKHLGRPRHL
ncbi:hypothetical protein [Ethanoligenens sp.]|uniref:hypothetical protein n=1 Tax=Ethanoligenens sp. TaxID=2099655 RepID=UPI0039EAD7D5